MDEITFVSRPTTFKTGQTGLTVVVKALKVAGLETTDFVRFRGPSSKLILSTKVNDIMLCSRPSTFRTTVHVHQVPVCIQFRSSPPTFEIRSLK